MNRRKAKKAFKKKWRTRLALITKLPRWMSPRMADRINEAFEAGFYKRLDEMLLYGTEVRIPGTDQCAVPIPEGVIQKMIDYSIGDSMTSVGIIIPDRGD